MKKIELEIINITQGFTHHHSYAVVLGEIKGKRRLPIVIGGTEAQAIAIAMENMPPARPLTHDLFKTVMDTFHVALSEIIITNLLDGVFYSKLICIFNGEEYEIDSRTSDAIALAIRFNCPIYIYGNILDNSGLILMEETNPEIDEIEDVILDAVSSVSEKDKTDYTIYTYKELSKMLDEALANENYEKAATIRDELNKREKQ
ncbi:MAG TPA: bifunctional nuclease family protein [Chitinophagales bacterium]|nr:bifunctional nuclease family protein [Chitinophagales bacterium]HND82664.1 bifunctional nuclease family protein [Chitinophagales bacterium]HNG70725.1 bifunctional nuclease family protein [Chitinophagales bacterium]HNJ00292.1 bifunctional nuclease family protein [Chitinophagales bacterium]HNK10707.1 bifunctional nuclease family protein [Chitinophagales bacterium]